MSAFEPWPHFDDGDIEAVAEVLRSGKVNYWTGGEGVAFEREYAESCDVAHAIAASNGTTALEMALHGLSMQCGDEVIVPSRTFIASASCVVARGGRPVCCDVDRESGNLTAATVEAALTPRTVGIIAVHLGGWPCDMAALRDLADRRGLWIIEDCAQAHGAFLDGQPIGSFGDAACFSFCQDKILTTGGEGGMMVTDRNEVFERAWSLKDHGKPSEVRLKPQPPGNGFRWLHGTFGTNMRMAEMQSAIGRRILRKLPLWSERRRRNAAALDAAFAPFAAIRVPQIPDHVVHARYKHYVYVRPEALRDGWDRDQIVAAIRDRGVPCFSGSCSEIYLEDAFPPEWKPSHRLPTARELGETSIMMLVHPTLSAESVGRSCEAIRSVLSEASATVAHRAAA